MGILCQFTTYTQCVMVKSEKQAFTSLYQYLNLFIYLLISSFCTWGHACVKACDVEVRK